jgi:hypothetical protein
LNLQFQGTVNTVRLYGPPRPLGSSQPTGSSQARGFSQPIVSSSKLVTRGRKIVPTMEKVIEVLEADQRKRKKPEWQKY